MIVEPLFVALLLGTQPAEPETPETEPVVAAPDDPITVQRSDGQATAPAFEDALRQGVGDRFAPCTAEPCDPSTGARLEVTVAERERDYDATVKVTRADGSVAEASVKCTICTSGEAGRKIAAKAVELLEPTAATEGGIARLEVTSSPSGAAVEVDGTAMGQTPLRVEVEPGTHRVIVRKQGHLDQQRTVELADGGEDLVRVELPRDRSRQQRTMRIAGWSLIGVGIAGVVTGIALIAADENPVKSNCDGVHVDRFGNCEFRWNTLGAGVGLLVPGILAAGGGTALVLIGRRGQQTGARARLQIGPGRGGLAMRF